VGRGEWFLRILTSGKKLSKSANTLPFGSGVKMKNRYPAEITKQFEKMSIAIASPIYIPEPKWIRSVVNMMAFSWYHGLKIYEMGITEKEVVDWARSNLARAFKEHISEYTGDKYTHILWLDTDHNFKAELACELAKNFIYPEVDAVTGIYYSRTGKPIPNIYSKQGVDPKDEYKHFSIVEFPEQLFEIDGCGFGAVMMKREVFDRVPEPWFLLDWRAGEDVAFCVAAKKHGVKIFADGRVKMQHVGESKIIDENTFKDHYREEAEFYKDKVKIKLGG
jgi:hypothetical protein